MARPMPELLISLPFPWGNVLSTRDKRLLVLEPVAALVLDDSVRGLDLGRLAGRLHSGFEAIRLVSYPLLYLNEMIYPGFCWVWAA